MRERVCGHRRIGIVCLAGRGRGLFCAVRPYALCGCNFPIGLIFPPDGGLRVSRKTRLHCPFWRIFFKVIATSVCPARGRKGARHSWGERCRSPYAGDKACIAFCVILELGILQDAPHFLRLYLAICVKVSHYTAELLQRKTPESAGTYAASPLNHTSLNLCRVAESISHLVLFFDKSSQTFSVHGHEQQRFGFACWGGLAAHQTVSDRRLHCLWRYTEGVARRVSVYPECLRDNNLRCYQDNAGEYARHRRCHSRGGVVTINSYLYNVRKRAPHHSPSQACWPRHRAGRL